jgi:hypothetical protein
MQGILNARCERCEEVVGGGGVWPGNFLRGRTDKSWSGSMDRCRQGHHLPSRRDGPRPGSMAPPRSHGASHDGSSLCPLVFLTTPARDFLGADRAARAWAPTPRGSASAARSPPPRRPPSRRPPMALAWGWAARAWSEAAPSPRAVRAGLTTVRPLRLGRPGAQVPRRPVHFAHFNGYCICNSISVSCTDMFCLLHFNTWSSYYYSGPKKTVLCQVHEDVYQCILNSWISAQFSPSQSISTMIDLWGRAAPMSQKSALM